MIFQCLDPLILGGDDISVPGSIDFELSNETEKLIKEKSPFLGATLSLNTIFYIDQNIWGGVEGVLTSLLNPLLKLD